MVDARPNSRRGDPSVVRMDDFGPQPVTPSGPPMGASDRRGRPRRSADGADDGGPSCTLTARIRHLRPACDLNRVKIYAHVKTKEDRTTFPSFATICAASTRPRSASPSCSTTSPNPSAHRNEVVDEVRAHFAKLSGNFLWYVWGWGCGFYIRVGRGFDGLLRPARTPDVGSILERGLRAPLNVNLSND